MCGKAETPLVHVTVTVRDTEAPTVAVCSVDTLLGPTAGNRLPSAMACRLHPRPLVSVTVKTCGSVESALASVATTSNDPAGAVNAADVAVDVPVAMGGEETSTTTLPPPVAGTGGSSGHSGRGADRIRTGVERGPYQPTLTGAAVCCGINDHSGAGANFRRIKSSHGAVGNQT